MRGFELFKLTQFNHMSEVKIHDSHQKYGYSIYFFFLQNFLYYYTKNCSELKYWMHIF